MEKIKTLLVPFDFSKPAKNALDYAVNYVGSSRDMHIKLVYADKDEDASYLEADFKKIRQEYGKKLKSPMSWSLGRDTLTNAILKAREMYKADLIIMGTGGSGEAVETDTHTSKLVLEADCPVLVIPTTEREFRIEHIALVLGRDEIDDTGVMATLLEVARRFNARVHVLTIENEPGTYGYSTVDEKNERLLEYYLESFYADHMFIENPDVVKGITEYATEKEIDMIAILPRNHAQKGETSKGRLTKILTLKSKTPILAID